MKHERGVGVKPRLVGSGKLHFLHGKRPAARFKTKVLSIEGRAEFNDARVGHFDAGVGLIETDVVSIETDVLSIEEREETIDGRVGPMQRGILHKSNDDGKTNRGARPVQLRVEWMRSDKLSRPTDGLSKSIGDRTTTIGDGETKAGDRAKGFRFGKAPFAI